MDLTPGSTAIVSTSTDALSLRGQPVASSPPYGPGSNEVGKLPRGSTVRIDGPQQGAFYPVTAPGPKYGFAGAAYLTAAPAAIPPPVVGPPVAPPEVVLELPASTVPPEVPPDDGSKKKMFIIGGAGLAVVLAAIVASSRRQLTHLKSRGGRR